MLSGLMRRQVTIALDKAAHPEAPDNVLVHRFRNFGEDLYREFSVTGQAEISLEEIDHAMSELHVLVKLKRHIGVVSTFIKKTLQQNMLDDLITVSRV